MTRLQALSDRRLPACDLHLHSTHSDGLMRPAEVVETAAREDIGVISLTDHDTTDGLPEASTRAAELKVELIPGIEISCDLPAGGERHLLGYGFDAADADLQAGLVRNLASRRERLDRTVEALGKAGMPLRVEDILAVSTGRSVGRPHVAEALLRAGFVRTRQEAFDRWLGDGKIGHVPRKNLGVEEAIRLLHAAGGVAVLAHPGRKPRSGDIEQLVGFGLDGVEVLHPANRAEDIRVLHEIVERFGLIATGGSDCHGDAEGLALLRARRVPASAAQALMARLSGCAGTAAGSRRASP